MSAVSKRPELIDYLEYERVVMSLAEEFPDFRIVPKSHTWCMKVLDVLLKVITFWRMREFMTSYTTTIGNTVYVGSTWSSQSLFLRASTLRHEAVHMRQRKRLGFLAFAFFYLLFPLPAVLATGRRDLEREAYEETLRAYVDYYGVASLRNKELRERMVGHFLGASYFWMWPFRRSMYRWYDGFVSDLEKTYKGPNAQA